MCIMCLMPSIYGKFNRMKWRSVVETMACCPPSIYIVHGLVREVSHSDAGTQVISCCLSSHCWAVNRLLYLWTRSPVIISYPPLTSIKKAFMMPAWFKKACKLCVNLYISIVNPLWTYIQSYTHTYIQAQPQTKPPLAPTACLHV